MQTYSYTGVDSEGYPQSGKVRALSRQQAINTLRSRNYIITELKEESEAQFSQIISKFKGVSDHDMVLFTRQLGTMIGSGLPINQALKVLSEQTGNDHFAEVVNNIAREIDGGSSLSDALANYEDLFGRLYLSLIEAGEASGNLEEMLARLAETLESSAEFKGKIKGAMIYPVIIVLVMFAVLAVMFLFVIPRLAELYENIGADLPFITAMMIKASNLMTTFWWIAPLVGVAGYLGIKKVSQQPKVSRKISALQLKMPVFGNLITEVQLTSFTRTLGMLVASGIPLIEALQISQSTLGNQLFRDAANRARERVEKGKSLAEALRREQKFPSMLSEMVAVGEKTGKVDDVLKKVSSYFDRQASRKTENLASALEPVVMVLLGIMVGFLVISLIMPIYSLTSQF